MFIRWRGLLGPGVILLAAAVALAPQMRGNSCGHDFDFHLVSWFDCFNSWRSGLFYPRWATSPNYGAGEPRFVFYPPLTWMLGAALGAALPWTAVPGATIFLILAASGLATRALARQALDEGAATLAGCAAIFSSYALFTAYERSSFAEMTGGFWIPLLLLFLLRDGRTGDTGGPQALNGSALARALDGSAGWLALVVAGAWLSNAPLGVMASYLLAGTALAAALLERSWAPVARAGAGAVMGLWLAAIYLIPAAWEQRWVDIRQAVDDPGLKIENSWLFGRHADPLLALHDEGLRRVSIIAVTMIAAAVVGLMVSWLRGRLRGGNWIDRRGWWVPPALIPFAVLILQLPVSLPVWNVLPKLRFLQFPWRWLVVLEAPMAIFVAAAVWPAASARRRWRVVAGAVCGAAFVAATAIAWRSYFQVCDNEDNVTAMLAGYRAGAGFEGTDEYEPPGGDNTEVATGLPDGCLVGDPEMKLGVKSTEGANPDWWAEQGSCEAVVRAEFWQPEHRRLRAVVGRSGYIILRLRTYPAWRVRVNGRAASALPVREDGLMAVPVPKGAVEVSVDWTTTEDVWLSRWVGGLGVLAFAGLLWIERRLSRVGLS